MTSDDAKIAGTAVRIEIRRIENGRVVLQPILIGPEGEALMNLGGENVLDVGCSLTVPLELGLSLSFGG